MSIVQQSLADQIDRVVTSALWQWRRQWRSWGTTWSYQDENGGRWEVAYTADIRELAVYTPTGEGLFGLDRVIGFDEWRTDVDHVATLTTVVKHLADLPGW